MLATLLDRAQIVEFSGADALAFAQSQFSSDVSALPEHAWQWSAWLDAQGRVRHVFALLRPETNTLLAWLPRGVAVDMANGLTRFVMRAKLSVRALPDTCLIETESVPVTAQSVLKIGTGWAFELPGVRSRSVLLSTDRPPGDVDNQRYAEWQLADIAAGYPWIDAELAGEFVPQALGLDRLGAISLNKGCYPGQEIVARLHYRGGNKRSCFRILVHAQEAPIPGQAILGVENPAPIGRILYAAQTAAGHYEALAVLPLSLQHGTGLQLANGARIEGVGNEFQVSQ